MSVHFLATRVWQSLREGVSANRATYLGGEAAKLLQPFGTDAMHESRVPASEAPPLVGRNHPSMGDGENVRRIHCWLVHLTPSQASDPRLWTCLTHSTYAAYTAQRWPIDVESDVVARIKDRYFVEGEGLSSLVRNSIARLWWFGHLTRDESRADQYELTDELVALQDMQQAFLERTIGRSARLVRTALSLWKRRKEQGGLPPQQGKAIQRWARLLRLHGAVVLLDALDDRQLENLLWVKLAAALNEDISALDDEETP